MSHNVTQQGLASLSALRDSLPAGRRKERAVTRRTAAIAAAVAVLLTGCSTASSSSSQVSETGTLRLGYTFNLADAPALAGLQLGYFTASLPGVAVDPAPFASNAAEVAALEHGQLDAAYIDPVAAVAAWQSAPGQIKIIAGAASGGAELVVRTGITSARQLVGAPLAAPAGGAQQAALDTWLRQQGAYSPGAGRITMASWYLVKALQSGHLAGAWEPAPQDAQMVAAGGRVLVNEASLWPGGRFTTAVLVVTSRYLAAHPTVVTGLLKAQIKAENQLITTPGSTQAAVNTELATTQGARLPAPVLAQSFAQITFTNDPQAGSILAEAQHAAAADLLKPVQDLASLYDLGMLNKLLRAAGQRQVSS
jgi:NitT/TauT family transport system substrate-binding protein